MGRFWGVLRSISSLMDSVDLTVLGLIGNYGWGCFRPKADVLERPLSALSV